MVAAELGRVECVKVLLESNQLYHQQQQQSSSSTVQPKIIPVDLFKKDNV
jgi:hypothetical protein